MRKKQCSPLIKLMESDEEELYETTENDCIFWFRILNQEVFNNKLSPITEFVINRRRGTHAFYECITDTNDETYFYSRIYMNLRYRSKRFFVEVLAHEMCHHYQTIYNEPLGHGPSFLKWRDKLNKKGLNLVRAYRE